MLCIGSRGLGKGNISHKRGQNPAVTKWNNFLQAILIPTEGIYEFSFGALFDLVVNLRDPRV
jgi:hypothetical protein